MDQTTVVELRRNLDKICKRVLKANIPTSENSISQTRNDIVDTFNEISTKSFFILPSLEPKEKDNLCKLFKHCVNKVAKAHCHQV